MKRHIPNLLTSINLAIGTIGIYYVFTQDYKYAFFFVIAAAFFDFFDGFAARILKVKSDFGKELDSLSDLVSFGLLPSFFMLKWLEESSSYFWVALLIVIFSALRLAKFNLDESQSQSFKGLPTPANAIMLTSLVFIGFELNEWILIGISIVSSVLLVSDVRLIALKFSHFRWRGNEGRWIFIGVSFLLFIVLKWTFLPFLIPFYVLVSLTRSVSGLNSEKT